MYYMSFSRMSEIPEATKMQLRDLTFGRENDSPMYAWTFNDGSCWAATLSIAKSDGSIYTVSWACLTLEVDHFPVVGAYTDPGHRGLGLGQIVSEHLLGQVALPAGTAVYAVAENWASWPKLLQKFGLQHFEWE